MALKTLGKVVVAVAGTIERTTKSETVPSARLGAHAIMIQAWPANTGKVWIGTSTMNKATGAGVIAVLPIPSTAVVPAYNAVITNAAAGFDLADLWLDVDVAGEGAVVSYLEA